MLKHQKGNCFDFSTLLCSMLIGAGYDAYCVNGYGSQDLCHMDLTRDVCPLTMKHKEVRGVRAALGVTQDALSLTQCASTAPGPAPAPRRRLGHSESLAGAHHPAATRNHTLASPSRGGRDSALQGRLLPPPRDCAGRARPAR